MIQLTCDQINDIFSQILDNEPIDDQIRSQFNEHLARCEDCRNRYEEWQDMENSITRTLQSKKDRHITTAKLAQFAEDDCDSEFEKLIIEDHLDRCSACHAAYEDILRLNQSAERFDFRLPLSWKIRNKIQKLAKTLIGLIFSSHRPLVRKFAYGAILATLLVFLTILSVKFLHQETNPLQTDNFAIADKTDSLKNESKKSLPPAQSPEKVGSKKRVKKNPSIKEKIKQLYANNFKPLPAMEGLLAYNARGEGIRVISPKSGQNFQGKISFQWEYPEHKRFYLKIYSNKGVELFNFPVDTTEFVLTKKLDPGLYYWKLETEDELVYLDKFFMRRQ